MLVHLPSAVLLILLHTLPTLTAPAPLQLPLLAPTVPLPILEDAPISTLLSGLASQHFSSHKLTQAYLHRIASFDDIHATLAINPRALYDASQADAKRALLRLENNGSTILPPHLPLLGIPFLVKDNIAIPALAGPTTAGSYALLNSTVHAPSTVVQRLLSAGAVLLGTTNMDEFAQAKGDHPWAWSARGGQMRSIYGTAQEVALAEGYGDVCGSSGGSALSVALGLAAFALGTQTGVSIVCPSGRGGVVGFKPGRGGMTPMDGVVPISKHLDVVGPIGRTVSDVELIWKVIKHPKGWKEPEEASYLLSQDPQHLGQRDDRIRIGVPKKGIWDDLDEDTPLVIPALQHLIDSLANDTRFQLVEKDIHNLTAMTSNETRHAVGVITAHELKIGINHYLSNWTVPSLSSVHNLSDIISYNLEHPWLELPPGPFPAFGHPACDDESYADQSFLLKAQGIELVGWSNETYREAKKVVERVGWEEGLEDYFWGEEGVDLMLLPTEGLSGTLASLCAVPDITLPLSYYPTFELEANATWPLYPYPQMPFGVSLMAARGHDAHELLLKAAAALEAVLEVKSGERRSMMRDSVRRRLESLERGSWGL